ncbi:non-ribosomal peptide synthetase [Kitasatospora sp. NBC_01287]|uniref:non-ribosomal peptide synthetase n=1 Tax=Kitasatospora sp. NBC_01287 TaxID=2903573 RepID=UPI00225177DD|nr:non-ribosomal peptide synthetase [Kitasatospora sp. NBC_01287]MCX4750322.1 non-ribosomal peptide synthetase [Kitasatospora sp. NBC_01287]
MAGPAPHPEWNPAPHPPTRGQTVHELFDWCVERGPRAVAVRHGERRVGYAELAEASHAYAAELERLGVGPGTLVPVLMPRSPEFLAVLLAVLRRGAAYAALDPRWPRPRLDGLLERLAGPVLVTTEAGPWAKPAWAPPAVEAVEPGRRPTPVAVTGDDPSAVFFTSGSTGTPKGVLTAHRGNVRLFDRWAFAPVGGGAVMPQSLAATWDAFGLDSWAVLLGGGTIVIQQDSLELARRLRELIAEQDVDTVFLPTAVFHLVVDSDLDAFAGLKVLGTGGERLSATHARRFLERHPGIPLHNMYGPVESTIAATGHLVTLADCDESGPGIPIGRPYDNTAVHILDGADQLCAVGETGEICLSGAGLALGYLNDPGLTAQRFVALPLGQDGAPVLVYRTGDLGRWSEQGLIHFEGRADRQVKLRGFRVELDDVEQGARRVEGVGSCAVVPLAGPDGACEDLCLFYVPSGGSRLTEDQLRTALAAALPGYLVPGQIHRLDQLPVLEDRKVDRHTLAALAVRLRTQGADGDSPRGTTEQLLADLFREILGVAAVPRDISFFALGGTSLTAAQLAGRLEQQFAVRLRLAEIFDAPTVRDLARTLEASPARVD